MQRVTRTGLVGLVTLLIVSSVAAQQAPQPVVRLGNWLEVGNDVFMHIIATADIRYVTAHNLDFEDRIRDRATSRNPTSTAQHNTEGDLTYAELRLGLDARYQKSLTFHLLFENQSVFDGQLIDDRSNASNPGGTDAFGRTASTENPGFRVERYWIRYKFPSTPLLLHVGADLQSWSQAGILGNDNPRIGIELDFGDLDFWATAVVERESARLGLENDNDSIYYVAGVGYSFKPHRVQFDVAYFRDRFSGADTAVNGFRNGLGWTGQRINSWWLAPSWTGVVGPVWGLVQGNIILGNARGGTVGLPAGVRARREYDIFAWSVMAYLELDKGPVRPFVGFFYGSADDNPRDNKLEGFAVQPINDSTQFATGRLSHLDVSATAGGTRDYSCPGRANGIRPGAVAGGDPYAIGSSVLAAAAGANSGFAECGHTVANIWNERIGQQSHVGIVSTYSNPGTLVIPAGLKIFPVKGHEVVTWYAYRAMVDTTLLEVALAPELRGRSIRKGQTHEVGAYWQWTLNAHFDFRLTGQIGIPTGGYKDLAELSNCNTNGPNGVGTPFQACEGDDLALKGEARFRGRF